jgi:hypothetical protein
MCGSLILYHVIYHLNLILLQPWHTSATLTLTVHSHRCFFFISGQQPLSSRLTFAAGKRQVVTEGRRKSSHNLSGTGIGGGVGSPKKHASQHPQSTSSAAPASAIPHHQQHQHHHQQHHQQHHHQQHHHHHQQHHHQQGEGREGGASSKKYTFAAVSKSPQGKAKAARVASTPQIDFKDKKVRGGERGGAMDGWMDGWMDGGKKRGGEREGGRGAALRPDSVCLFE